MALSRGKYKRVPDLYVTGTEFVLRDGLVLWLQVLNPFEQDEAKHDAQVARSRLVMALRSEHGSDERMKIEGWLMADGRDQALERLFTAKLAESMLNTLTDIRDDPEWQERMEIAERADELLARPAEDPERKLMEQINSDYLAEIEKRQVAERSFLERRYDGATSNDIVEEYVNYYVERRGNEVAIAEYNLTELWYAARVCDGQQQPDGTWDHDGCESHRLQVWETKADVRSLPEELSEPLYAAMGELNMTVREAKNLARQGSSSESSPLPNEAEESTPSTQPAMSASAPGS